MLYLIFVCAYGVPKSGQPDGNTLRYVQGVLDDLQKRLTSADRAIIFFPGDATNPKLPKVTEAQILQRAWLDLMPAFHVGEDISIVKMDGGLDLQENLMNFKTIFLRLPRRPDHLLFYGELHRRGRLKYMAKKFFPQSSRVVVPIPFDERQYGLRDYLARFAELASAWLSWEAPGFYTHVERPRRMKKIGRDRDGKLLP